jgi:hypothetical protein
MEVDKNDWEAIQNALATWEQTGKLTTEQATDLKATVAIKRTDREQIAQYFFFIALFCTLLAFGAIFINEKLLERIKLYFSWNDLAIAGITAVLSIAWFVYTGRKRTHLSFIAYETNMVLGGLAVLTSLIYICKQLGSDKSYITFLSLSFAALAILSIICRSRALWIGAIGAAIGWFGSFSSWAGSDNLFLGMNYPVRFTVFGILLIAASLVQTRIQRIAFSQRITYIIGMFLFFVALWCVSIFGNYNTIVGWQAVRQVHVLAFAIIFGAAAAISFYLGMRYKEDLAKDLGVLFLLINLYTRYFEYFWDSMNKGIFFLVLAITFGFLGWWLERKKQHKAVV